MPSIGNHVDAIFLPESVNTSTTLRINGGDLHLDDNKKILLGQSDDLQIYHDGNHSYIDDAGTGNLYIRSGTLPIQNLAGTKTSATFNSGAGQELRFDNDIKFVTTATGIDVTGLTDTDTLNVSSTSTFQGNVHLLDDDRLQIGGSAGTVDGLEIYHDGSDSYINDTGTGALQVRTSALVLRSNVGENMAFVYSNGAVQLYHNNSKKFETTTTGIDVTGNDIKLLGPTSGSTFTTSTLTLRGFRQSAAGQFSNIDFSNIDANSSNTEYLAARISAQVPNGADGGELKFFVTPHNSTTFTSTPVLILHDDSSAEFSSDLTIGGNLTVNGTTTTINSTTLTVDDLNIVLASGAADSAAADGAGITIDGANESLTWVDTNKSFKLSTRLAIGNGTSQSSTLRLLKDMGGENVTTYYGFLNNGLVQPDVTGTAYYNFVQVRTDGNNGTGYTISNLDGYSASVGSGTIHADTTITNLTGFEVKNTWIEGTNNYGFRGQIPSGTNRWNVYMDGTAPNYFAGNVGIGTNDPGDKLDVLGDASIRNVLKVGTSDAVAVIKLMQGTVSPAQIQADGDNTEGYLAFFTRRLGANYEQMRIDKDGNVGIGTNSPTHSLTLDGDNPQFGIADGLGNYSTIGVSKGGNGQGNLIISTSADTDSLVFQRGATETMRIDSSGRLLVGTTSWSGDQKLVIYNNPSNSGPGYLALATGDSTPANNINLGAITYNASDGGILAAIRAKRDGGTWTNGSSTPTRLEFSTTADSASSPTERMRIDSSGDVGIGTDNPDRKLHVNGDTRLDGIVQIGDGTSTSYQLNIETPDSGNNDNTFHAARIDINGWKNDQSTKYGLHMDIDSVATDDLTANRSKYGIYLPWNFYVPENAGTDAGDGSTHNANYYGQFITLTLDDNPVSTYNAGKANAIYGNRAKIRLDHGGGAINVRGTYTQVQAANDFNSTANTIDKAYGLYSLIQNDSDTTTFDEAYGVYSYVNQDNNGTITDAYGVYSRVDRDAGTGTNAYGLYCSIEGAWTGLEYGVYSTGETSNYFSGNVGLNVEAGEQNARLHIRSASTHLTYGIHFQNTNDQGRPDALALTNMYDRDIGITFRSGDSNGANAAKRWTIWNDAANSGGDNNRFNISPGAGNASLGITILQNNNVGISTASPTEKLHVEGGNIFVEHNAPFIKFAETGLTGSPVFWTGMDAGNFSIRLDNSAPYPFRIHTKGANNDSIDFIGFGGDTLTDALKLTAHGTNPTYLDLKGNDTNARMRYYESSTERWNIGYDVNADAFTFYDAQSSVTRMLIYDNPNNGIVIGAADNGGLTWPSTDGGGGTVQQAALRVDGGGHPALFCYNDEQSGDPVAVFAKGNEADDNQVVIIAGDGDETEELLDIRSSTDPPNTSGLLSFAPNNANSKFRVYGDGRVYSSYRVGIGTTSPTSPIESYGDFALRSPDTNDTTNTKIIGQFSGTGTRNVYLRIGANTNRRASIVFSSYNTSNSTNTNEWSIGRGDSDEVSASTFFIATGESGGSNSKLNITSGGNVGIGNTSPSTLLHIGSNTADADAFITFGKRASTNETNLPFIGHVDADGNSNNDLGIGACSSGGAVILYAGNSNPFTAGSERLRVASTGNVGIGTTNPTEKLHIHGGSFFGGTATFGRNAQINTNGQGFFRYDDNNLTVPVTIENRATNATAGHGAAIRFRFGDSAAQNAHDAGRMAFVQANSWTSDGNTHDAKFVISIAQNNSLADRFEIDNNGIVTIGDASINPADHIEVGRGSGSVAMTINDGKGNANLTFNHRGGVPDNTSTGQSACRIETSVDNAGARMYFELGDSTSNGTSVNLTEVLDLDIGLVEVTGNLDVSGSLSQNTSDGRLKENLVHIPTPLDKVDQLHGYTFDWKAECADVGFTPKIQTNDIGLIAQDVQAVMPQAVTPAPFDHELSEDGTEDVSVSGENYLTVQYERLVPLLVEAIKELRQEVETLKAQISGS